MLCNIILVLTSVVFVGAQEIAEMVKKHPCPGYCKCYLWNDLKRVDCNKQNMFNVQNEISRQVEVLDLSYNVISELENYVFQYMQQTKIQELMLQHNQISNVQPKTFYGLKMLKNLDLSFNHIRFIPPRTFEENTRLVYLNLAGNVFGSSIVDLKLQIPSLQVLDLGNCRIPFIPPSLLENLPNVKELFLNDNTLQEIGTEILEPLTSLVEIDLGRNPMLCDERTKQLLQWFEEKNVQYNPICGNLMPDNEVKEKKLEKMILAIPVNHNSELESNEGWSEEEWEDQSIETLTNQTSTTDGDLFSRIEAKFHSIPSIVSAIIGFQFGLMSGVWLGYCCFVRRRKKPSFVRGARRRPLSLSLRSSTLSRRSNIYTWQRLDTPPGTPPPPYISLELN